MSLSQKAGRVEPTMNAHELVLRESDGSRLDRLVRGLIDERVNAVVVADDEGLLDHYGRLFAQRLRQQSAVKVEVYFPNSTEAVLARFNRILADLKVSDAISPTGSTADHRVLVIYDGQATELREVQLLGRLLRDFPGANTRVLMLLNRLGAGTEDKVEALGKKALRWDLTRPTADEARALLDRARLTGSMPEAQALLDSVGVQGLEQAMALRAGLSALAKADAALGPMSSPLATSAAAPPAPSGPSSSSAPPTPFGSAVPSGSAAPAGPLGTTLQAASFAASLQRAAQRSEQQRTEPRAVPIHSGLVPTAPVEESPQVQTIETREPTEPAPDEAPAGSKARRSPLLLAGLLALTASAALTAWQHREQVLSVVMPADSAESQGSASEPRSQAGDAKKADANEYKTLGPLPEQVSNEELQEQRRKAPLPIEPEPQKSEPPKPVPPKSEPPKPEAAKATPALLEEIKTLAPGFYVQHLSRETRAEVVDFWNANPSLAKARLLKLKRLGAQGDNFVLLSGPFRTLDDAKALAQRADIPKDTWIRPASAIRKLLPDSTP